MPELDDTHTCLRLRRRIAELEAGSEIAKRDICAVLNEQQQQELESELAAQKALKKTGRARTEIEKAALGRKTIREVRIEVLKRALAKAEGEELTALRKKQDSSEIRRARIYVESYLEAIADGKPSHIAQNWANNELTRAGLNRIDAQVMRADGERDKVVRELEEEILKRARSKMTADELEQHELLEEHLNALVASRKGRKNRIS